MCPQRRPTSVRTARPRWGGADTDVPSRHVVGASLVAAGTEKFPRWTCCARVRERLQRRVVALSVGQGWSSHNPPCISQNGIKTPYHERNMAVQGFRRPIFEKDGQRRTAPGKHADACPVRRYGRTSCLAEASSLARDHEGHIEEARREDRKGPANRASPDPAEVVGLAAHLRIEERRRPLSPQRLHDRSRGAAAQFGLGLLGVPGGVRRQENAGQMLRIG